MITLRPHDPLAVAAVEAIHGGNVTALRRLLTEHPGLATVHRLVEGSARTTLQDAATLGLLHRVEAFCAEHPLPTPDEINHAFWGACHGGQLLCAAFSSRAVPN